MNGYTEGRVRQNKSPKTQQTDCSLRAMKTDDNTEIRTGHKEDSWDTTNDDTEGCNQEETSARSEQTLV